MAKKILFIDSDEAFASGLAQAAAARGHTPLMSTNSEQGITLAKQELPDLIVVCVEAQPTNGYMLCTRLKKDDRLRTIPVILTSANATQDSFEKHKKLKTRAEEYLIKPFDAPALFGKVNPLLGLPPDAPPEEIIEMHDEPMGMGIGELVSSDDEPIHIADHDPAPEGDAFMVDEVEEVVQVDEQSASSDGDPDLQMFDKAFDALEMPGAPPEPPSDTAPIQTMEHHAAHDEVLPLTAEAAHEAKSSAPHAAPANSDGEKSIDELLGTLESEPAAQGGNSELEARVHQLEVELAEKTAELESVRAQSSGGSAEVTRLKEQRNKQDKEILRLKEELHGKERELVEVQDSQTQLEHQVQVQRDEAVKREAAAKALQQRAEALAAAAKKFERELSAAREELKSVPAIKAKVAELEKTAAEGTQLQKKLAEAQQKIHEVELKQTDAEVKLVESEEKLAEVQAELDKAKAHAEGLEKELEQARDLHTTELAGARELHATELDGARELHAQEVTGVRGELSTLQHEHAKLSEELTAARDQHSASQTDLNRLNGDLETVRAELQTLAGEKELLADEREELKKQVTDALAMAAQNEDRAVKAYQKIKGDERLRERTRKALAIALQLLDEAPAVEALDEEMGTHAKQSA